MAVLQMQLNPVFKANRSFLFYIMDNVSITVAWSIDQFLEIKKFHSQ